MSFPDILIGQYTKYNVIYVYYSSNVVFYYSVIYPFYHFTYMFILFLLIRYNHRKTGLPSDSCWVVCSGNVWNWYFLSQAGPCTYTHTGRYNNTTV